MLLTFVARVFGNFAQYRLKTDQPAPKSDPGQICDYQVTKFITYRYFSDARIFSSASFQSEKFLNYSRLACICSSNKKQFNALHSCCLLYTSPSPRDGLLS